MMAVAVNNFQNFLWSRFFIIRQNVNMATNAILNCGLTPILPCVHVPCARTSTGVFLLPGVVARAPETDTITGRRPLIYGLLAGMFVCLAVGILTLAVRLARRPSVRPAPPSCTDPESLLADSTVTTPSTSRSAADITITSL